MRMLKDQKGAARIIEAFLAAMLLLSCLTLIPAQANPRSSPGGNSNLASMAQNALVSLDGDGHLAALIGNHDWADLGNSIGSALPLTVWYNLTIYDNGRNVLNPYPICNGGAVSDTMTSVEYVCASQTGDFAVYALQLQLAVEN